MTCLLLGTLLRIPTSHYSSDHTCDVFLIGELFFPLAFFVSKHQRLILIAISFQSLYLVRHLFVLAILNVMSIAHFLVFLLWSLKCFFLFCFFTCWTFKDTSCSQLNLFIANLLLWHCPLQIFTSSSPLFVFFVQANTRLLNAYLFSIINMD